MAETVTPQVEVAPETPPEGADQSISGNATEGETPPETPESFEVYLAAQSDEIKDLYKEHTKGLKSALTSERDKASDLAKQLRDAAKNADEKTAVTLNNMASSQELAEKKAAFYEDASSEGCNNLRLAWIAAQDIEAFDQKGNPDFKSLKDKFPELFHRPVASPRLSAGAGTQTPPTGLDMDNLIRRAAGRNV